MRVLWFFLLALVAVIIATYGIATIMMYLGHVPLNIH
jgi:hypothetical protein